MEQWLNFQKQLNSINVELDETNDFPKMLWNGTWVTFEQLLETKRHKEMLILLHKSGRRCPVNLLWKYGWSKNQCNFCFFSSHVPYVAKNKKKTAVYNSLKSAINRLNFPVVLKLLEIGIRPQLIDVKLAKYLGTPQIHEMIQVAYEKTHEPNQSILEPTLKTN